MSNIFHNYHCFCLKSNLIEHAYDTSILNHKNVKFTKAFRSNEYSINQESNEVMLEGALESNPMDELSKITLVEKLKAILKKQKMKHEKLGLHCGRWVFS